MTHSLHRRGSIKDLHEDYVLLALPKRDEKGRVSEEIQEKMRQIWEIVSHYESELVNFGNGIERSPMQLLTEKKTEWAVFVVFKDKDTLKSCIEEIKNQQIGVSIVISGLYGHTKEICSELGISPHTVQHSLDIHGKTERLPEEDVLEITTMCGHGVVSTNLVKHMVEQITEAQTTFEKAAKELSRMCTCGIFNTHRAEKVLRKLTSAA